MKEATQELVDDQGSDAASGPEVIHFLGSLTLVVSGRNFGHGRVAEYGQELVLTDELRRLNSDRNGVCVFDMLDDEDAQVRRWGRVVMRRGPWPDGVKRAEPGSQRWWDAYEAARKDAWKITDEVERAARLRQLGSEYGQRRTSRTIATIRGDEGDWPGPP